MRGRANPDDPRWRFLVKSFFPDGRPAMETVHQTDWSMDMEVRANLDIGRTVEVYRRVDRNDPPPLTPVSLPPAVWEQIPWPPT